MEDGHGQQRHQALLPAQVVLILVVVDFGLAFKRRKALNVVLILVVMEVEFERLNICLSKEFEDSINPYYGGFMIDSPDESLKI